MVSGFDLLMNKIIYLISLVVRAMFQSCTPADAGNCRVVALSDHLLVEVAMNTPATTWNAPRQPA